MASKKNDFCEPSTCPQLREFDNLIVEIDGLVRKREMLQAYAKLSSFVSGTDYRKVMAPVFAYDGIKAELAPATVAFFTKNPDRHLGAKHATPTFASVSLLAYYAVVITTGMIADRDRQLAAANARVDELVARVDLVERPELHRLAGAELSRVADDECAGTVHAIIPRLNKTVESVCPIKREPGSRFCKICVVTRQEEEVERAKREIAEKEAELKKQLDSLAAEKEKIAAMEKAAKKIEAELGASKLVVAKGAKVAKK